MVVNDFVTESVTEYDDLYLEKVQTFLTCRFHKTIFVGAVWKFELVLWSYILELADVLHTISLCKFSFVEAKTNASKNIVSKRRKKN